MAEDGDFKLYENSHYENYPGGRERSKPGTAPDEKVYDHTTDATGRKVLDKPANRAILKGQRQRLEHQARLAALADSKRAETITRRRRSSSSSAKPAIPRRNAFNITPFLITILFLPLLSHFLTRTYHFNTLPYLQPYINKVNEHPLNPFARKMIDFTPAKLARFDGSDENRPVYLGLDGDVYDVSANRRIYGKGGSYNMMAGRDAARAFITGCFETHLTHDLRGLSKEELKALDHWKSFFSSHAQYRRIGRVLNPDIDPRSPIPEPCRPGDAGQGAPGADAARDGRRVPGPLRA